MYSLPENEPFHGSFHPHRQCSGNTAAESGLFRADITTLGGVRVLSERPVSASVGLVRTSFGLQSCRYVS